MTSARHDRTIRLLAAELEAVTLAGERTTARTCDLETHVLRLAAATRNAVRLEIISYEEADGLWAGFVGRRHPHACWSGGGPSLAA